MVIFLQLCIFAVFAVLRGRSSSAPTSGGPPPTAAFLTYVFKRRDRYYSRHVGLERSGGIPFIVRPEKPYHRLLKSIGISSEINVGNPAFDQRTSSPPTIRAVWSDCWPPAELQKHVQRLFEFPVKSLHATRRRIWCVIPREDAGHARGLLRQASRHAARHLRGHADRRRPGTGEQPGMAHARPRGVVRDRRAGRAAGAGRLGPFFPP